MRIACFFYIVGTAGIFCFYTERKVFLTQFFSHSHSFHFSSRGGILIDVCDLPCRMRFSTASSEFAFN